MTYYRKLVMLTMVFYGWTSSTKIYGRFDWNRIRSARPLKYMSNIGMTQYQAFIRDWYRPFAKLK